LNKRPILANGNVMVKCCNYWVFLW